MSEALTVIIPTWNRCELLEKTLESLVAQTAPCSVLVVDNGSSDSTREMCRSRFSQFGYLGLDRNLGFAKAVNIGIRQVKTAFLALLNNDTEADPHWVSVGLAAFAHYPEYWFFASRMINYVHRHYLDSAGDCYDRTGLPSKRGFGGKPDSFAEPEPVLGASAGAAFYRRALFERIGLFDEGFTMYLEDVDLSLRAQLHGYRCLYLPSAIVYHIEAASDNERPRGFIPALPGPYYSRNRVYWITRNRWQLMVTYQPFRNLPWLVLGWSKSFFFHLLKAGFTIPFLRGLGDGILLSREAGRKRLQLRRSRTISTQDLCRLLNRCSPFA